MGILVDETQKTDLSARHPVVFCPPVIAYSSFPASFLPLKGQEITKWAKIQLEKTTNSFISVCSYLKMGNYILAAGSSSVLPEGVRVTFPHFVSVWHHNHFGEPGNPGLYLFSCDSFSAVLSVSGINVRGYYRVTPERTRDALYEALMLARRQEGGDKLKVYSNIEIEGAEQIDLEELVGNLPATAFVDTRSRASKIYSYFLERPRLVARILYVFSGILLSANVALIAGYMKGTQELARRQALRASLMGLKAAVGDLNPVNYRCLDVLSPELDLPVTLDGLQVSSKECTADVKLYAFTDTRTKELLSCVQEHGKYQLSQEGDWHVISWHISNPERSFECFKGTEKTGSSVVPVPASDGVRPYPPAKTGGREGKNESSRTGTGRRAGLSDLKARADSSGSVCRWGFLCGCAHAAELDTRQGGSGKKGRAVPVPGERGVKGGNIPVPSGAYQRTGAGEGGFTEEWKVSGGADPGSRRDLLKESREKWLESELRRLEKQIGSKDMPPGKPPAGPSPVEQPVPKKRIHSNPGGFRIAAVTGGGEVFILTNGTETLLFSAGDTFSYAGDAFSVKRWSRNPLMVVLENEDGSEKVVFTPLSADSAQAQSVVKKQNEPSPVQAEKQKVEAMGQKDRQAVLPQGVTFLLSKDQQRSSVAQRVIFLT